MQHLRSALRCHPTIGLAIAIVAITAILSIPLVVAAEDGNDTEFIFTFDSDAEGWMVGFADLPVDYDQSIYELDHAHRPLPDGLEGSGVYVQGHNRSDDLFMFLKRQVEGLRPGAEYRVHASVDLATNVPAGLFGIGGSPGESVYVKAGASAVEPETVVDDNQYLRMNIDKGNQSRDGESMVVIGNVAHPDVVDREYRIKTLDNANMPLTVNADEEGSIWLIVGTDSGFEGLSALYYSRISYRLSTVEPPATMTPESVPTPVPTSNANPCGDREGCRRSDGRGDRDTAGRAGGTVRRKRQTHVSEDLPPSHLPGGAGGVRRMWRRCTRLHLGVHPQC